MRSTLAQWLASLATAVTVSAQDANLPPTLSVIPDQFTPEDVSIFALPFTVSDSESPPERLRVSATIELGTSIQEAGVTIWGDGTNRWLTIVPAQDASGVAVLAVTAADEGGLSARRTFKVTVLPGPRIGPIADQTVTVGTLRHRVTFTVTDPNNTASQVIVKAKSLRESVIATSMLNVTTEGNQRVLTINLGPNAAGSAPLQIDATDRLTTNSVTFIVNIVPRRFAEVGKVSGLLTSSVLVPKPEPADFDSDGDLDVIAFRDSIAVNIGRGLFLNRSFPATATGTNFLAGDFDRDGDIDAFVYGGPAVFLRNRGTNSPFMLLTNAMASTTATYAAAADFDNDGDLDLALSQGSTWLARNDGETFTRTASRLPGLEGALAAGDYDLDGDNDLVIAQRVGQLGLNAVYVRLFANDGNGTFDERPLAVPQFRTYAAGWIDVNGDGFLDLWLVQASDRSGSSANTLVVLRQDPAGFAEVFRMPPDTLSPASVTPQWGDFDNDGDVDFVAPLPGPETNVVIYANDGIGHFEALPERAPVDFRQGAVAADFTSDGAPDLIGGRRVFRNEERSVNSVPNAPRNLRAFLLDEAVFLTWTASQDGNQSAALSYNLRVGTSPNGNEIMPSMSGFGGVRFVPRYGNAGHRLWMLLRIPDGPSTPDRLYWSVQAIDNGFQGGPFAGEQTLILPIEGNQPPGISVIDAITIPEDTSFAVEVAVSDDHTVPSSLRISVASDNPEILPSGRFWLRQQTSQAGSKLSLSGVPLANRHGQARITISAVDNAGASNVQTITVTVMPVNDAPMLIADAVQYSFAGRTLTPMSIRLEDVESSVDELRLIVRSLNPTSLPDANINMTRTQEGAVVVATPATQQLFDAPLEFTVTDPEGGTTSTTVILKFETIVVAPFEDIAPSEGHLPGRMVWADLDDDGVMDLVAGSLLGQPFGYVIDPMAGLRRTAVLDQLGTPGEPVDAGDFDNDGDVDLLMHTVLTRIVPVVFLQVYRNDGAFQFTPLTIGPVGAGRFVDLDRDGLLDIIAGEQAPHVRLFRNTGAGFADWPVVEFIGPANRDFGSIVGFVIADIDEDGADEIAVQSVNDQTLENQPQAFFRWTGKALVEAIAPTGNSLILGATDFFPDGLPDLLVRTGTASAFTFWRNLGLGKWTETPMTLPLVSLNVATMDLNTDGYPDVIQSSASSNLMLLSTGEGIIDVSGREFRSIGSVLAGADVDANGHVELASAFLHDAPQGIRLYRVEALTANSPPEAPSQLRATSIRTNGVSLRWERPEDPDQGPGLTYNLRVGKAPGSHDVLSPMSRPDGRRRVSKPGNAGWRTQLQLTGLEPGRTYYWTVQAVDNSFLGGAFATESTFTVAAVLAPPHLTATRNGDAGEFQLRAEADQNSVWRVESTEDFETWSEEGDLRIGDDGRGTFQLGILRTQAFIRLRQAP